MTLDEFIAELNTRFGTEHRRYGLDKPGPKFTRVVVTDHGQQSVYCFVDHEGNVYKSAGWKAPAKGIRANLATFDMSVIEKADRGLKGGTAWLYAKGHL